MSVETCKLAFDGYWREPNIGGLPALSGIYCVYACVLSAKDKTVSLKKLLYIGESEDIRKRVKGHEKWPDWRRKLTLGQELCFSGAPISPEGVRLRAEAAMIYKHKPPVNVEYVNSFPFDATTIHASGKNALLTPLFTVHRKDPANISRQLFGRPSTLLGR